ncbi:hypothetical protein [[Eubacterium] cellulosolvens]
MWNINFAPPRKSLLFLDEESTPCFSLRSKSLLISVAIYRDKASTAVLSDTVLSDEDGGDSVLYYTVVCP